MPKAILCDMDGTLLDSNTAHAQSWQRCFKHFGIHTTVPEVQRQIGKGGDQLLPVFVSKARLEEIEQPLKDCKKQLFEDEYLSELIPFPQARELLEAIAAAGVRIAMASSAGKSELQRYLDIVGVAHLVEKQTSSDDAEESKPEPDIFLAALDKLNLAPEDAVALGDTPWDAQSANRAGVQAIGVQCGGWSKADLRDAGCIEVYQDPADLLAHLKESKILNP